jgi:tetratricopeptide (TPR) repeat protein
MSIWQLLRMLFSVLTLGRRHKKSMEKLRGYSAREKAMNAMLDAYRLGDYEGALNAAEGLKVDPASYSFYRGSFLMYLGRFDEAEKLLRNRVKLTTDPKLSAISYCTLGEVQLQRQRYDEALDFFSTALKHWPDRASGHRYVAEAWLRKGSASEALKWAKQAVEMERGVPRPEGEKAQENYDYNLGEELATLAWAVAESSKDRAEVDRLVGEALPLVGKRAAVPAAQVRYHAGLAYAALGASARSRDLFEEAASIDPHGIWGRAARETSAGVA